MTDQTRLFISHSSQDNALTEGLCQQLRSIQDGEQPVYEVLVDYTNLQPGKLWPKQLHEWMASCHAAVLLLTKDAVCSPWVLKEATILAWRLSLDPKFHLFLIRFPDVKDEMLAEHKFDSLMLGRIQQIGSYTPADVAQKIWTTVGKPVRTATPFDKLVGRLADLFAKVGDHTLKEVAEQLSVSPPVWKPDQDVRAQYVEEIARQLICEDLGGYKGVHEIINTLSLTTSAETLKDILWILAPWWVDTQAAGRLAPLTARIPRQAAAMNGTQVPEFTAYMYVRRAHPLSRLHEVIPTAGGSAGDLSEHFTNEICDQIRKRENRSDGNEDIINDLKDEDEEPTRYVVLPAPLPPKDALQTLFERFPKLTFILWTGEALDQDDSLSDIEWLEPPVDVTQEKRALRYWRKALKLIDKKNAA